MLPALILFPLLQLTQLSETLIASEVLAYEDVKEILGPRPEGAIVPHAINLTDNPTKPETPKEADKI